MCPFLCSEDSCWFFCPHLKLKSEFSSKSFGLMAAVYIADDCPKMALLAGCLGKSLTVEGLWWKSCHQEVNCNGEKNFVLQ